MEKRLEQSPKKCFNCGTPIKGEFCHNCGQRVRDNLDRSLGRLLGEFFGNVFFLDNRFLLSLWFLIRYPARMTVEFLEGKRKKFISPVTLFLFLNLIYFIVNPLTDYSLSLYDQTHSQPYSPLIKGMVDKKLQNEGLDQKAYSLVYQNTSNDMSKSIMILNIPIIALFIYLITFKKRKFYFDSLIFSFHFFSLFMLSWVLLDWMGGLIGFFTGDQKSFTTAAVFLLFSFIFPLLYAILGLKKFINVHWYWAIPAGMGAMIGVGITNLIYRFIIFFVTFWAT